MVEGHVRDSATHEVLPAVVVMTLTSDSQRIWTITNEKGHFRLFLPATGEYAFVFSLVGYKTDTIKVRIVEDKDMGFIDMKVSPYQLPDVEVEATGPTRRIDKDVYVVDDSMRRGANSARDILMRLPAVTYDPAEDKLKVGGSPKVLYLVDGIERTPQYVLNIDPKRIQKVEIIRHPAGRFAFMGYDVVINIITQQNYYGYDFAPGMGFGTNFVFGETRYMQLRPSFDGTLTLGRWTFSGTGVIFREDFPTTYSALYEAGDKLWQAAPPSSNPFNSNASHQWSNGEAQISYAFAPQQHAGLKLSHLGRTWRLNQQTLLTVTRDSSTNVSFRSSQQERQMGWYITGFYKRQISRHLNLEIQSEWAPINTSRSDVLYGSPLIDLTTEQQESALQTYSFVELTYEKNFQWSVFGGYVLEGRWTTADLRQHVTLPQPSTDSLMFSYRFMAHRLYVGMKGMVKKWQFLPQVGVSRYIFSGKEGWEIFPIFMIFRQWQSGFSVRLRYSLERKLPTATQQTEIPLIENLLVVKKGNNKLSPYYSHNASLELSAFNGVFSLEPYVEYVPRRIFLIYHLMDSMLMVAPEHALYYTWGVRANGVLPLTKFLFLQLHGGYYSEYAKWNNYNTSLSRWFLNATAIVQLSSISSYAFLVYEFRPNLHVHPQGYFKEDIDGLMILGWQQSLLRSKAQLQLFMALPVVTYIMDLRMLETYSGDNWKKKIENDGTPMFARGWRYPLVVARFTLFLRHGYARKVQMKKHIDMKPEKPSSSSNS